VLFFQHIIKLFTVSCAIKHQLKILKHCNPIDHHHIDAKSGGGAAAAASAMRRKMRSDEALKILNIERVDLSAALVETHYKKFYDSNDPKKGGSFYLQSKIYRAREALMYDLRGAGGKGESSTTSSDNSNGGSDGDAAAGSVDESKFGKK